MPTKDASSEDRYQGFLLRRMPSAERDWYVLEGFPVDGPYPFTSFTRDGQKYSLVARDMFPPENPSPAELRALYDYWAPNYDQQHPWVRKYGHDVVKLVGKPTGKVIDLCTGTGMLLEGLAQKGADPANMLGVDSSEGMIGVTRAKQRGVLRGATFKVADLSRLNFSQLASAGSVQLITAAYGFHHLMPSLWSSALRSAYDLLSPGGHLVIVDSTKREVAVKFRKHVAQQFSGRTNEYEVPYTGLKASIKFNVGFQVVTKR